MGYSEAARYPARSELSKRLCYRHALDACGCAPLCGNADGHLGELKIAEQHAWHKLWERNARNVLLKNLSAGSSPASLEAAKECWHCFGHERAGRLPQNC